MTRRRLSLGAALLALATTAALADPGYYLVTPYSTPGQAALDLRYWTVKSPNESATLWPEVGLRYGVSSRWTTELFASYIGDSFGSQKLSSINWQNDVLLTQGQVPFDLALHAQLIRNREVGNALELGPVFQTEWGSTQLNANLFFAHDWASTRGTQVKIQWQAMHRLQPGVRVGLRGFGELGRWDDLPPPRRQSHRAGPVLHLGTGKLDLDLAYLWGKTYGGRGDMFTAQVLVSF